MLARYNALTNSSENPKLLTRPPSRSVQSTTLISGLKEIKLLEHESYKWITKENEDEFEFAGADKVVFDLIK